MPRIDLTDDQFDAIQNLSSQIAKMEEDRTWYPAQDTQVALATAIQRSQATIGDIALAALKKTWSPGTDGSITEASGPPAGQHG